MSKFSSFKILRQLSLQFLSAAKRIFVFGFNGREVMIITKDLVFVFGDNRNGCLGLGHEKPVKEPRTLEELSNKEVVQISHGYSHVIALTSGGQLYCWGNYSYGQTVNETNIENKKPKLVNEISDIISISCGDHHSIALSRTGELFSWGLNSHGQLGIDTTENTLRPTLIKGFDSEKIVEISCGSYHSIALTESGRVFSWGNNYCGQLGIGYCDHKPVPTLVCSDWNDISFEKVVCGAYHSLLLSKKGDIYAFGFNKFGQVGNKSGINENIPIKVKSDYVFTDIAAVAFDNISIALSQNNKALVWGQCDNEVITTPMQLNEDFEYISDVFALYSKSKIAYQAICTDDQNSMHEKKSAKNPTNSETIDKIKGVSQNKFLSKVSKLSKTKLK